MPETAASEDRASQPPTSGSNFTNSTSPAVFKSISSSSDSICRPPASTTNPFDSKCTKRALILLIGIERPEFVQAIAVENSLRRLRLHQPLENIGPIGIVGFHFASDPRAQQIA